MISKQRVHQPLVGDDLRGDLGLEGAGQRGDVEQHRLLEQRSRRRAAERHQAVVERAALQMRLDVLAGVAEDAGGGQLDREVAAHQLDAGDVAALVGEPAGQQAIAGFGDQEALRRAGERRGSRGAAPRFCRRRCRISDSGRARWRRGRP